MVSAKMQAASVCVAGSERSSSLLPVEQIIAWLLPAGGSKGIRESHFPDLGDVRVPQGTTALPGLWIWARAGGEPHLCSLVQSLDLQLWHHIQASTTPSTQQHSCGNLGQDKMSKNTQIQESNTRQCTYSCAETQGCEGSGVE